MTISIEEKRKLVSDQCRVITHLAAALGLLHSDYAATIAAGKLDDLLDQIGHQTHRFMDRLGDMLNAMDAASDEWMDPIFDEARKVWGSQVIYRRSESSDG